MYKQRGYKLVEIGKYYLKENIWNQKVTKDVIINVYCQNWAKCRTSNRELLLQCNQDFPTTHKPTSSVVFSCCSFSFTLTQFYRLDVLSIGLLALISISESPSHHTLLESRDYGLFNKY